jgi:hypothetical protein
MHLFAHESYGITCICSSNLTQVTRIKEVLTSATQSMQVLSVSALTGENIDKVLPMIIQAAVDVKAVSGE